MCYHAGQYVFFAVIYTFLFVLGLNLRFLITNVLGDLNFEFKLKTNKKVKSQQKHNFPNDDSYLFNSSLTEMLIFFIKIREI